MHSVFDLAAERLEHHTSLNRLEARGTLRLALKDAGLDVGRLAARELAVVFEKLMVPALQARGVKDAAAACRRILDDLSASPEGRVELGANHPDEVFRRLGGD